MGPPRFERGITVFQTVALPCTNASYRPKICSRSVSKPASLLSPPTGSAPRLMEPKFRRVSLLVPGNQNLNPEVSVFIPSRGWWDSNPLPFAYRQMLYQMSYV